MQEGHPSDTPVRGGSPSSPSGGTQEVLGQVLFMLRQQQESNEEKFARIFERLDAMDSSPRWQNVPSTSAVVEESQTDYRTEFPEPPTQTPIKESPPGPEEPQYFAPTQQRQPERGSAPLELDANEEGFVYRRNSTVRNDLVLGAEERSLQFIERDNRTAELVVKGKSMLKGLLDLTTGPIAKLRFDELLRDFRMANGGIANGRIHEMYPPEMKDTLIAWNAKTNYAYFGQSRKGSRDNSVLDRHSAFLFLDGAKLKNLIESYIAPRTKEGFRKAYVKGIFVYFEREFKDNLWGRLAREHDPDFVSDCIHYDRFLRFLEEFYADLVNLVRNSKGPAADADVVPRMKDMIAEFNVVVQKTKNKVFVDIWEYTRILYQANSVQVSEQQTGQQQNIDDAFNAKPAKITSYAKALALMREQLKVMEAESTRRTAYNERYAKNPTSLAGLSSHHAVDDPPAAPKGYNGEDQEPHLLDEMEDEYPLDFHAAGASTQGCYRYILKGECNEKECKRSHTDPQALKASARSLLKQISRQEQRLRERKKHLIEKWDPGDITEELREEDRRRKGPGNVKPFRSAKPRTMVPPREDERKDYQRHGLHQIEPVEDDQQVKSEDASDSESEGFSS